MSFKENTYQQLSLTDSFSVLTPREQKALEKSWAKVFADEIFPAIDENRFSVLYSDKASGPNTPFADGCAGRKDCYGGRWCIQRLRCPAGHKPPSGEAAPRQTAWKVLLWCKNSSIEFQKALQLQKGQDAVFKDLGAEYYNQFNKEKPTIKARIGGVL